MVLSSLRDRRNAGKRALLAPVVRTGGYSPQPVDSAETLTVKNVGMLPRDMAVGQATDGLAIAQTQD